MWNGIFSSKTKAAGRTGVRLSNRLQQELYGAQQYRLRPSESLSRTLNEQAAQQQTGSPFGQFSQQKSLFFGGGLSLTPTPSPLFHGMNADSGSSPKPRKVRDYSENLRSKDDPIIPLEDR